MPSHFSTIGFSARSEDEFLSLTERVIGNCASIDTTEGRYLHWSSRSGAELWLQIDAGNDIVGTNPHFAGESIVRVSLTERITRPDSTVLDGAFHGWADPANDNPESGCYPFVFDAPDFRLHDKLDLPAVIEAQIAAFAHEVSFFASPEAFAASQTHEVKFASQSFIPIGLFSPAGESTEPPESRAFFAGHIRKAEARRNELTGNRFWWALVETLGGVFDVVIDPELIEENPKAGGVLSGAFWLSGRLIRKRPGGTS
jgi:hypothetical protein